MWSRVHDAETGFVIAAPLPDVIQRPARRADHAFAYSLYAASAKPLLSAMGLWNEAEISQRFSRSYVARHARILCIGADTIGWIQVSRMAQGFHLHQLHLVENQRNRGIGTRLIVALQETARSENCPVTLNMIKGNPALSLYTRLGFIRTGEDESRLHMAWRP